MLRCKHVVERSVGHQFGADEAPGVKKDDVQMKEIYEGSTIDIPNVFMCT